MNINAATMQEYSEYDVYDIFTPSTQARINFVRRESVNDALIDALRTRGKQVIIYGESGSGKSTLLTNILHQIYPEHITTRCHADLSYDSLILQAFDDLGPYYLEGKNYLEKKDINSSIRAEFASIRASLNNDYSTETTEIHKRVLPPQLTAQRLAKYLGEAGVCWILEDFHKINDDQKQSFSQILKLFVDMSSEYPLLKTVSVGAVDSAREVVEYDNELENRISEIKVDLMSENELRDILKEGGNFLNTNFDRVSNKIIRYCGGMASVCHQLALNICHETGIQKTLDKRYIFSPEEFDCSLKRYIAESSDTLRNKFELACKQYRKRKYDNGRIILTALANGPQQGMHQNDILTAIRKHYPNYPSGNLTSYLRELATEERGALIRKTVSNFYRYVEPIQYVFARAQLCHTEHEQVKATSRTEVDKLLSALHKMLE